MAETRDWRAQREAKIDALHTALADAVNELVSGEDWKRAIEFAARFRSRSFSNTLLIWKQHMLAHAEGRVPEPFPTLVAGFKQWQTLGRQVAKGQSGYAILAPVTRRMASDNPSRPDSWRVLARGERPKPSEQVRVKLVGVKPAHVWDVSQTTGDDLPTRPGPTLLQGQAPAGLWDGLAGLVAAEGFELSAVADAAALGGANGVTNYVDRTVKVRADMDDAARVKTLAHELGHVLLHGPTGDISARTHRGIGEVEAESVAMMIAAAHGMDTAPYTIPYVSGWATTVEGKTPAEVIQATGDKVRSTAIGILDQLTTTQVGNGDPPGLDRQAGRTGPTPPMSAPKAGAPVPVLGSV
jgi:hypothetical protein